MGSESTETKRERSVVSGERGKEVREEGGGMREESKDVFV